MSYVLIIDDEGDLASLVEFNLRAVGLETATAATGEAGFAMMKQRCPDLVLLDLMLPDLSGKDLCRRIRADAALREVAVVMLTARGDESDRVAGFEVGADDYVTKPFSVRELVLRVQSILRRRVPGSSQLLRCGPFSLDLTQQRFFVDGREVPLTELELKLMRELMRHKGQVCTREALLEAVWGLKVGHRSRTLDTHLMRLRPKLGRARARLKTVRAVGYRLVDGD